MITKLHVLIMKHGRSLWIIAFLSLIASNPLSPADIIRVRNLAPQFDAWDDAVASAQALLTAHPNFEKNLRSYESISSEINQYLRLVEQAQPALDLIDDLKRTDILLLGNAWDALTEALEMSSPGSGQALEALDDGLRSLLALKGKLDALSTLDDVRDAVSTFRSNPSQGTLKAWADTCPEAIQALDGVDTELRSQLANLNDLTGSLEMAQEALSFAGSIPGLGDALSELNRAISKVSSPVYDLETAVQELHQQIEDDIEVMEQVQDIVYRAENPSAPPLSSGSSERATTTPSTLPIALGIMGLAGLALVTFGVYRYSRRKVVMAEPGRVSGTVPAKPPARPPALQMDAIPTARATLVMQSGPLVGQHVPVHSENLLIGRGSSCDVRLLDREISRQHARLRFAEGAWYIQDQGSAGGTFVNGVQIQATRLKPGDQVRIGSVTFIFQGG